MIHFDNPIYLASKSPRRKQMLHLMGIEYRSIKSDIEEIINYELSPVENVKKLSLEKCKNALSNINEGIVLSADTIVVLNKQIIGKPKNRNDAKKILKMLSGRMHLVYTAFTIADKLKGRIETHYSRTRVYFRELNNSEINDYVKTGSPMDKAGAYGIQDDFGAVFVEKIEGCYYNVLGFPVSQIYRVLKSFA